MKVLVTGARGQLGQDMVSELKKRGHEVLGLGSAEMDVTDPSAVERVLTESGADVVIHCAAYTAVDAAEDDVETCRRVNASGTENIARVCGRLGIKIIYLSTDYVFDGTGIRPWEPDDVRHPLNVYGQTKYEGELAVETYTEKYFIVRISWVFGLHGKNFVKTMLNLSKKNNRITVVSDQIGSPTYTRDVAVLLADMAESDRYGHYHASNEGICSWYEFACEIFRQAGIDMEVVPVSSDQYPAKASRPSNSRMEKSKLTAEGFHLLPPWQDALARFLEELQGEK